MKNLAQNADFLKQNPTVKLLIEGHCDERGSREYNLVLGEKRALETRRYLESLGVKNALTVTSYGKERPVCAEHDESCYWRRSEEHTSELQSLAYLVCRLLLEKKKYMSIWGSRVYAQ